MSRHRLAGLASLAIARAPDLSCPKLRRWVVRPREDPTLIASRWPHLLKPLQQARRFSSTGVDPCQSIGRSPQCYARCERVRHSLLVTGCGSTLLSQEVACNASDPRLQRVGMRPRLSSHYCWLSSTTGQLHAAPRAVTRRQESGAHACEKACLSSPPSPPCPR